MFIVGAKVICSISVVVLNSGIGWAVKADASGIVKGLGSEKIYVDFSKSDLAKQDNLVTDLKKPMLVDKEKCVQL